MESILEELTAREGSVFPGRYSVLFPFPPYCVELWPCVKSACRSQNASSQPRGSSCCSGKFSQDLSASPLTLCYALAFRLGFFPRSSRAGFPRARREQQSECPRSRSHPCAAVPGAEREERSPGGSCVRTSWLHVGDGSSLLAAASAPASTETARSLLALLPECRGTSFVDL